MPRRPWASACAAIALAVSGCGIAASSADLTPQGEALAQCEPFVPFGDLDALTGAVQTWPSFAGLVGGDIATDVRLHNDDLVMAFGDSIIDTPNITRDTSVRNSLLAFSSDRMCLVLGLGGTAFVPDRVDGVGYWPTSLVQVSEGADATVAMFLQRVRGGTPGANS
jgi:hypothetical protein